MFQQYNFTNRSVPLPFIALTLLVGSRKGIQPVKQPVLQIPKLHL